MTLASNKIPAPARPAAATATAHLKKCGSRPRAHRDKIPAPPRPTAATATAHLKRRGQVKTARPLPDVVTRDARPALESRTTPHHAAAQRRSVALAPPGNQCDAVRVRAGKRGFGIIKASPRRSTLIRKHPDPLITDPRLGLPLCYGTFGAGERST